MEDKKEQTAEQKKQWQEFLDDNLGSMDLEYNELRRILDPKFNNKTKYIETKLMKECFKRIGNIIKSHHILRREQEKIKREQSNV